MAEHRIPLQNIPIRSDLGAQIRKALRDQRPMPRALARLDFASIEASIMNRMVKKP